MMRLMHELRRREEGQALVLAAISMLVLSLCALATVNLTYAVSQKIRLQNSADAAAYTVAAQQARAMNFFAYTNRAMVVQHASQMSLMAMLSYFMFGIGAYNGLAQLLAPVPVIGWIFNILVWILAIIVMIVDGIVAIANTLIDGLTAGLSLTQSAVGTEMRRKLATGAVEEVRRSNPDYVVTPFVHASLGPQNVSRWDGAVNTSWLSLVLPTNSPQEKLDRAIMTEIANSARHEWTAYGGPNARWTIGSLFAAGIPRRLFWRFNAGIFGLQFGKIGRTEWGSFQPQTGLSGLLQSTDEYYSTDEFRFIVNLFGLRIGFRVDATAVANRRTIFTTHRVNARFTVEGCGLLSFICNQLRQRYLDPVAQNLARTLNSRPIGLPIPHPHFHIGQLPYARFRPSANPDTLFNQPSVATVVTLPSAAMLRNSRPFMGRFGVRLGGMSPGASTLAARYGGNNQASRRGFRSMVDFGPQSMPIAGAEDGFHALSAAMAYYHRPGDWREPPNTFNPFWGAKLIPVSQYPNITQNPLFAPFFDQRLVVH